MQNKALQRPGEGVHRRRKKVCRGLRFGRMPMRSNASAHEPWKWAVSLLVVATGVAWVCMRLHELSGYPQRPDGSTALWEVRERKGACGILRASGPCHLAIEIDMAYDRYSAVAFTSYLLGKHPYFQDAGYFSEGTTPQLPLPKGAYQSHRMMTTGGWRHWREDVVGFPYPVYSVVTASKNLRGPRERSLRLFPLQTIASALWWAAVSLVLFMAWHKFARWTRINRGRCPTCGYSMSGLRGAACPECGSVTYAANRCGRA